MSKSSFAFLFPLAAVFSTAVQAAPFIGVSASIGTGDHKEEFSDHTGKISIDSDTVNAHIGFMLSNNNRFIIGLEKINIENDSDEAEITGARIDLEFVYGQSFIQPYFGLGTGYYNSEDLAPYKGESLDGYSLQVSGGMKFNVHNNLEFDLHLQHQGIFWQEVEKFSQNSSVSYTPTTIHTTLGFGVDFKF